MRLSDLIGSAVTDAQGATLGNVQDVRLVQDGPYVEGFGHALRVEGIVTGKGTMAVRLGFARAGIRGPWPLTTDIVIVTSVLYFKINVPFLSHVMKSHGHYRVCEICLIVSSITC